MWKPVIVGAAALAIAGSSLVYAQQRDQGGTRWRPSQEDHAAFADAGIAALKAGLRLTPDQEKNWPAFESALRDVVKMHQERFAGARRDESRTDDPVARLRRQAEMMSNAGATLKRLADAQEPLYTSLDDGQKNRFRVLANILTNQHRRFAQMRGHRGMMQEHHGMMQGRDQGMRGDRNRGGEDRPGGRGMRDRDRGHDDGMMNGMGEQGGQL
jgi:hypothetical protein